MMKKTVLLIMLIVMLSCVTVRAADSLSFSCEYAPKSENSSTFSVGVGCGSKTFALADDDAKAACRGIKAAKSTFDLRPTQDPWRYILIGASAAALILVLLALVIVIAKRLSPKAAEPPKEDPEPQPQTDADDLTPEEKQAIIDELNREIKP